MDFDTMADAFCVGLQPMERWRPYVQIDAQGELNPKDWTPQAENERLISKRDYHARCAYQYTQLAQLSKDCGWEVYTSIHAFSNCALLEMRYAELALANFQMLCGTIGVNNRECDKDMLYLTAMTLHSTHLTLHDILARKANKKNNSRKEILQERPSLTDSKTQLARGICNGIRAVHAYFEPAYGALRGMYESGDVRIEDEMEKMVRRMQMVIKQLDNVLVVLTGEKGDQYKIKLI